VGDVDSATSPPDPAGLMASRGFLRLLVLVAILGVVASLVAWGFLELVKHLQEWVYTDLPEGLGYDSAPRWWSLPVLALAGLIVAFVIARLPGGGGHVPAAGLNPAPTQPIELPGVVLAGIASIGFGAVLGPEAPLIAIGGGLGLYGAGLLRGETPPQVSELLAASSTFAAVSFLFGSPLIAAMLLIEATGLGGPRLPLVLIPGLMASAIGSLTWLGMGSFTGLDTDEISIPALHLPQFIRPDVADFGWTILLAVAAALVVFPIFRLARRIVPFVSARPFVVVPAAGLAVSGLAIAFSYAADKSVDYALFSGEFSLEPLVENPGAWSVGALALLIGFKGLAYSVSLAAFRGGPVFAAMFLGAAGGVMASHLPGFELTPAVAVGMGAAVTAVLSLPLTGAILGIVLTLSAGPGASPLVIVGVVAAYLTTLALNRSFGGAEPARR
jgi:H+/Cl- antiporter ClcA